MSLTVSIGQLAFLLADEPKEVGRFRKALRAVNRTLMILTRSRKMATRPQGRKNSTVSNRKIGTRIGAA
jgi:hypothetical protein